MASEDEAARASGGRGPAYPFITLQKAVERAEQIRDQSMHRIAAAPADYYRAWGYTGVSGNARQTVAALNQYGLIDYVGRGDNKQLRLSELAKRIVLDRVPDSPERAMAIRVAAVSPSVHRKLWDRFGADLPPAFVIETFLSRDLDYTLSGASNVAAIYRDTFAYAGLSGPDNMPDSSTEPEEAEAVGFAPSPTGATGVPPMTPQSQPPAASDPMLSAMAAVGGNDIKIMLDGDRLRVSAYVDLKGAKRLLKALNANMALLEDEDDDDLVG